ncbi:MAG: deoxyribonuclease IV [Candidatus Micrarchaeota archaeon]|nr:deoxyribonuclease IV [Candidatus Micrarchaeota archaeon]
MQPLVGMAVSSAGSIDQSVDRAEGFGCNTFQTFVSSPMVWKVNEIGKEAAAAFIEKRKSSGIVPVVIHMPYLANFASPEKAIYEKSKEALRLNIDRCNTIGADYLVMHLGSDMGQGKEAGIERVISAISEHVDKTEGKLLLENQAGNKNSVGSDLKDLHTIFEGIGSKKAGYCIDTCHAFAAGYDMRKKEVMEQMAREIDFGKVDVVHVNDSKFDLGSARDRHARLGTGHIGIEGFKTILGFGSMARKPLILETPTQRDSDEPIDEVRKLREIASRAGGGK